jgi:hypothetical protein
MGYVNFGSVTAIGLIFPITGMIALGMRFYGRLKFVRSIELDDLLIVPAAVRIYYAHILLREPC